MTLSHYLKEKLQVNTIPASRFSGPATDSNSTKAHTSPPIDPSPPRLATLREDLSNLTGTRTPASILFSMPSSGNATEMMVFAFGTSNPRTKDTGAALIRHVWVYHYTMNLTQTVPDFPSSFN
ncbi:hypothetical protein RSAG8_10466, partial [Rhizoctonia solani AG-8 WAC10335]